MVEARLRQVHRGHAGRWTAAAALLSGAVTVLAACGGGATGGSAPESSATPGSGTVSSAPVIRGAVDAATACTPTTTSICAVPGANPNEVNVSWVGSGTGFIVQYQKPGSSSYRNPAGSCAMLTTTVSAALQCTATSVPTGTNKFRVATYRNGGAGAYSSLKSVNVIGAPGAPVIGAATVTGSTTATVAFTAPTSNGNATITKYTATSSPGGITGTLSQSDSGTINVTGLSAGTSYTFTVTATNTTGLASVASNPSGSVTTMGVPVIGAAIVTGATTATVAFTAPTLNGGSEITKYTATSSPAGGSGTLEQAGDGTIPVSGLTAGTSYTFTVTATNAAGLTSGASAPSGSVTTNGAPGAPVIGAATTTATNNVDVAFTAPASNGGATITKYTATSSPEGITGIVEQSGSGTITVKGLTSGTSYTFTVTATNAEGLTSVASAPSNSVTIQVPGAPAITNIENYTWSDCVRMKVTIGKPTSDGGSPITKYTVMLDFNNGGTKTAYSYPAADATSGTVNWNDLPAAQGAKLTVTATNAFGVSTASPESATTTKNQPTGPTRNCS